MAEERPILLATNTFGLYGEVNGVAYTCRELVAKLSARGIRLDVLTYGPREGAIVDGSVRLLIHEPVHGLRIDPYLRIDPFFHLGRIARIAASTSYSLVHSSTPDPLGWFASRLASQQGIPFVAGYHTALDSYARVRAGEAAAAMMTLLLRWYYSKADLVLAPSAATAQALALHFRNRVEILGRGVDSDAFSPRFRTRPADDEVRALYVGRIAPEKGLEKLAGIFRLWRGASLTVVGDGPYLPALRRAVPWARFMGFLTGPALAREFADADLFVFPSETDTFANVVLQAMSSGLPVVVTDRQGASASVIDGVTGFVTRHITDFANACARLAGDGDLRKQMGLAARQHALGFRWSEVTARLLALYESTGWNAAVRKTA